MVSTKVSGEELEELQDLASVHLWPNYSLAGPSLPITESTCPIRNTGRRSRLNVSCLPDDFGTPGAAGRLLP